MLIQYFFDQHDTTNESKSASASKLVIFRAVAWALMTFVYFWQVVISKSLFILVEYMTLQGVAMTWLYFSLITVDAFFFKKDNDGTKISCKNLSYWTTYLFESAACLQVPITILYWALLFKSDLKRLKTQHIILFALKHSVPMVLLLIDFVFNKCRFKLRRLILILLHGAGYLLLNIVYSKTARPVYPIMTWNNISSVIYALSACLLIVVAFLGYRLINSSWKQLKVHPENQEGKSQQKLSQEEDS